MNTLLLTRSEVERLLDPQALLTGLRNAFAAYSLQRTIPAQRARSPLPGPGGAGLGPEAIHAELGEVIGGSRAGRAGGDQITIYGCVGLAFQDLAAAWQVYQAALIKGVGRMMNFMI